MGICIDQQLNFGIEVLMLNKSINSFIDVSECGTNGTNNCHSNATCTNSEGIFSCSCDTGFQGNGTSCSGNLL